jgi:hypothetical protein
LKNSDNLKPSFSFTKVEEDLIDSRFKSIRNFSIENSSKDLGYNHSSRSYNVMDNNSITNNNFSSMVNNSLITDDALITLDLRKIPLVERGKILAEVRLNDIGEILEAEKIKDIVFRGGIDHELRSFLWKFLLGYYDWSSNFIDRKEKRNVKERDYFRMKLQWQTIDEAQKINFTLLRERENLIDKDVKRTDREHKFFQGEDNTNLIVMKDILMTYNMINFDLGYVQGKYIIILKVSNLMSNL